MNVSVRFNEDDVDNVGNKFPAVYIRLETGIIKKFLAMDEYPRVYGILNEVEIWDSENKAIKKMQLTKDYMQPYAYFGEEKMLLWPTTFPGNFESEKPIEIPYTDMLKWRRINLKDVN
jgi:hypothetical protein